MRKLKRFYYIPGMISLVLLPILCYPYLQVKQKRESGINLIVMCKYAPNVPNAFDTTLLSNPKFKRTFKTFKLNGPAQRDSAIILNAKTLVNKIAITKDTINAVKLVFEDGTNYNTFIQSVNIAIEENACIYAVFENNLYILYATEMTSGRGRIHEKIEKAIESYFNKIYHRDDPKSPRSFKAIIKPTFWPIYLGYLFLVCLSFFKLKKALTPSNRTRLEIKKDGSHKKSLPDENI